MSVYPNGFIYAFLASKIGNLSFWKLATGGVQPYVTDSMIATIPIPDCSADIVAQSNALIKESAKNREAASEAKNKALDILSQYVSIVFEKEGSCQVVNSKSILSSLQLRIDPPALMNSGVKAMKRVKSDYETKTIGEIDGVRVYRPGIFKRNKVSNGYPYIKGSEIFDANPFRGCEYLSRTRTPFVEEMKLHEGQVLITCAGSVGDIKLITKEYDKREAIGSQDIIRLESNDVLFTKEYLFVYLQLPFVYDYIQSMKYGSVIERIEPFHVESIPVIKPTKEVSEKITSLIQEYMDYSYRAFKSEEEAISLIEKEIESWSK